MPPRLNKSPFGLLEPKPAPKPAPKPPLDETAEIQRAANLARADDVAVLVLGEGQEMIGEMASRSSLDLKDTKANSIMDIWYPGSEGGNAAANLLFGDATPGEPVTVTVDLKNTGTRSGDEVAQLYIHQRYGTSARPVRELKGFQRVTLKPGESRTLRFTLTPDNLRYWSAVTHGWVQDESQFDVWIGGDSTAQLAGSFEVKRP